MVALSSNPWPHLELAKLNWFASGQFGFLTTLCLIWIICFSCLLCLTSLSGINTAEGKSKVLYLFHLFMVENAWWVLYVVGVLIACCCHHKATSLLLLWSHQGARNRLLKTYYYWHLSYQYTLYSTCSCLLKLMFNKVGLFLLIIPNGDIIVCTSTHWKLNHNKKR